ncbi:MAG: Histidine kinase [Pseudomonadota bacterium]|nr:Histidine kinase [Pseudomonadota bacterium]
MSNIDYATHDLDINSILYLAPGIIYWKDLNSVHLGCNHNFVNAAGFNDVKDVIGKTDYDMPWGKYPEVVEKYRADDRYVIETGNKLVTEDNTTAFIDGVETKIVVQTAKNPLFDKFGRIIGVLGTAIDITKIKENERLLMDSIIYSAPGYMYWKNLNLAYLGCNRNFADIAGFNDVKDIIGKTDYDTPWGKYPEIVEKYMADDRYVIETASKVITEDDAVVFIDGVKTKIIVQTAKTPLFDKYGTLIGVLGIAINITDAKENERLQRENEKHKVYADEQEKFRKIVGQMAHDIRSPLSTLKTIVQTAKDLPEESRITLRRAEMNIEDITNHMLNRYKPESLELTENNRRQYVLVSVILAEVASERRYKYKNTAVQFDLVVTTPQINNFVFIQIEPSNLRRMLSNLINNAAESLSKNGGKITLELESNDEWVIINVMDNGVGIPLKKLQKLREKIGISTTKKTGFGIGLTQVFDVLESNYGEFEIHSSNVGEHHGTSISIKFPKAKSPNWLAHEINITPEDIIIIVDDDESIHGAWDSRINYIIEKFPNIQVKHFMDGNDALQFMSTLTHDNVCLLNDYELINQELNGLDIIRQSKIKRSILVTSHYADSQVRKEAAKIGINILPKELAYSIPIKVKRPKYKAGEVVSVHMIFVDDEPEVVEGIIADHYSHLIIDYYNNPFDLLKEIDKYPHNTKIIMDNNYQSGGETCPISGIGLAEMLKEKGYTNLYLYSWETCEVPDYVNFILKTDKETMAKLDQL